METVAPRPGNQTSLVVSETFIARSRAAFTIMSFLVLLIILIPLAMVGMARRSRTD